MSKDLYFEYTVHYAETIMDWHEYEHELNQSQENDNNS
jgi:hypothetical protein